MRRHEKGTIYEDLVGEADRGWIPHDLMDVTS